MRTSGLRCRPPPAVPPPAGRLLRCWPGPACPAPGVAQHGSETRPAPPAPGSAMRPQACHGCCAGWRVRRLCAVAWHGRGGFLGGPGLPRLTMKQGGLLRLSYAACATVESLPRRPWAGAGRSSTDGTQSAARSQGTELFTDANSPRDVGGKRGVARSLATGQRAVAGVGPERRGGAPAGSQRLAAPAAPLHRRNYTSRSLTATSLGFFLAAPEARLCRVCRQCHAAMQVPSSQRAGAPGKAKNTDISTSQQEAVRCQNLLRYMPPSPNTNRRGYTCGHAGF